MKPEHAQEIYDIISNLDNLANENCIGDRDKIDEAVERARELLRLERPDVPEQGTVVEYLGIFSTLKLGRWNGKLTNKPGYSIITGNSDEFTEGVEVVQWRYPGEKEWRE